MTVTVTVSNSHGLLDGAAADVQHSLVVVKVELGHVVVERSNVRAQLADLQGEGGGGRGGDN